MNITIKMQIICEPSLTSALHSLKATIEQLNIRLNAIFANWTSTLSSEYIELIGETKQSNGHLSDRMVKSQALTYNCKCK